MRGNGAAVHLLLASPAARVRCATAAPLNLGKWSAARGRVVHTTFLTPRLGYAEWRRTGHVLPRPHAQTGTRERERGREALLAGRRMRVGRWTTAAVAVGIVAALQRFLTRTPLRGSRRLQSADPFPPFSGPRTCVSHAAHSSSPA